VWEKKRHRRPYCNQEEPAVISGRDQLGKKGGEGEERDLITDESRVNEGKRRQKGISLSLPLCFRSCKTEKREEKRGRFLNIARPIRRKEGKREYAKTKCPQRGKGGKHLY